MAEEVLHPDAEGLETSRSYTDAFANDTTEDFFVKIRHQVAEENVAEDDNQDEPDVLDINVVALDKKMTALHTGIAFDNRSVVEQLISDYGADPLLPVKLVTAYNNSPTSTIIPLVLAMSLQEEDMLAETGSLLILGASSA